ncbi:MAG: DUF4405 domain-containing protein [Sedimentisphaerales bacterium]|nr:DUF4405 domain-containing protein [Sedimentisphaerales bacterium]
MRRTTLNFIVDAVGFVDLLLLAATGVILRWVLPPGSGGHGQAFRGGRGGAHIRTLWGLGRHDWGDVHFVLSLLFVFLILVHLILHWTWIKTCIKSFLSIPPAGCDPEDEPPMQ